ncbi:MAG: IclR family transcriptional regulator [Jatrophihabitans sp.]|uniref:IclR family transcriptional regulator n=1 Tax=Jatrophihabitans sp. TaxID=1932789 RepID=UPI003F7F7677
MPGAIQSVERAAALLHLVAEHPGELGLSELAEALGLAKGTTHGLLSTLRDVGFVEKDAAGKYGLGRELAELTDSHLDPHDLRSHAINWADALAARSGEAVRVAALVEGEPVIVHHVFRPDDSRQVLETGRSIPAHATALGKVLRAWAVTLPPRAGDEWQGYTAHTITDPKLLARALIDVRRQGWAVDVEECVIGEASIAAPIHGPVGRVTGAIAITGPIDRLCDARRTPRAHLVDQVLDAAQAVSRDIVTARR